MSRVRQDLGEPTQVHLRRLFLSPGSQLRLRCGARGIYAREDRPTPSQYVAVFRAPPPPPRFSAQVASRIHAAIERAQPGETTWRAETLHQERRGVPAHAELQGSRGRGRV